MKDFYDYLYFDYHTQEEIYSFTNKLLPEKSLYRTHNEDADMAKAEWGLDLLLLRLIQKGNIEEDSRSCSKLNEKWKEFCSYHSSLDFNLKDVIDNGWIRIVWDRWYLPQEFNHPNEKSFEQPLAIFMQMLKQLPHPDDRNLNLTFVNNELELHRQYYPELPELDWFISKDIILKREDNLYLNCNHDFIVHYSSFLTARLWEEEIIGPSDPEERLTWWKDYFEILAWGDPFFQNINTNSQKKFLDAALNRLLLEEDLIDWEKEQKKFLAEELSRSPEKITVDLEVSDYLAPPPSIELEKLDWMTYMEQSNAGIMMKEPRSLLNLLFSLICHYDEEERLQEIIGERTNRPYFYQMLSTTNKHDRARILPRLLLEKEALLIGMYNLIHFNAENIGNFVGTEQRIIDLKERDIWEHGLSFFAYSLNKQTEERAANIILELIAWFYHQTRKPISYANKVHLTRNRQKTSFLQLILEMPRNSNNGALALEELLPNVISNLITTYEKSDCPLMEDLWPFGIWLFEQVQKEYLTDKNNSLNEFAKKKIDFYIQSFFNHEQYTGWSNITEREIESIGWLFITEKISDEEGKEKFLQPIKFQNLLNSSIKNYSNELKEIVGKIRTHIRLLSYLSLEKENEEFLTSVNQVLFRLLLNFQLNDFEKGKVDIFDPNYEINNVSVNLLERVSKAINRFSDDTRNLILREFKENRIDIRRFSILYNAMDREEDKRFVIQSIDTPLVDKSLESIAMLPEVQNTVTEMLNTENQELANLAINIMDRYTEMAKERNLLDWLEWELGEKLRAFFILDREQEILDFEIPECLKERKNAIDYLNFYKALVQLNGDEKNQIEQSIKTFETLVETQPENISHKVNLVASNVTLLKHYTESDDNNTNKIQELTKDISEMFEKYMPSFSSDSNRAMILAENRLYMSILIENQTDFWNIYYSLTKELRTNFRIGTYAVQVRIEQKDWDQASQLLQELIYKYGNNEKLLQLKTDIEEKKETMKFAEPTTISSLTNWDLIGYARNAIKTLAPHEQAKAYFNRAEATVHSVLVRELFDACNKMSSVAPTLLKYIDGDEPQQGAEDHYNDILKELLNQSIKELGWTASTQSRGGFSRGKVSTRNETSIHGGIGERDITIHDGNNREISIVEGLRLKDANKENILSHFRKLFSYDASASHFYFLLNWGFHDKPAELWERYKNTIYSWDDGNYSMEKMENILDLFPFLQQQEFLSFYTKHSSDTKDDIYVIHLYVDVKMTNKRNH